MKVINTFLALILAFTLSQAILAFTLDATILRADFVTEQVNKSGVYNDLSKQLAKQVSVNADTPQAQAALDRVLTAEFLQSHINSYLHALEEAYRTGGVMPTLDLTAAITEAQALGLRLTPQELEQLQSQLTIQPGSIAKDTPTASQAENSETANAEAQNPTVSPWFRTIASSKWLFAVVSLVLGVLVWFTGRNRWRALGRAFIYTLVLLGLYYGVLRILPGIAKHQLEQMASANPLTGSVNNIVTTSAAGVAQYLLYGLIAVAGLAVVCFVLGFIPGGGRHHGPKKAKPKEERKPLSAAVRE